MSVHSFLQKKERGINLWIISCWKKCEKISIQSGRFEERYQDLYKELLYYYYEVTPSKMRRTEVTDNSPEETLTVGKMLQKAADMCCHYDDYTRNDIRKIGNYITDMLMVRPFVMLAKK